MDLEVMILYSKMLGRKNEISWKIVLYIVYPYLIYLTVSPWPEFHTYHTFFPSPPPKNHFNS